MSCPDCVSGSTHSGTPSGTEVKFGNIDAYAIGAEDSKRIIVVGVDVFGWKFVNTRLLADEYASKGFRVIIPDLFNGWEIPRWTLDAHVTHDGKKSFFQRYVAVPASLFIFIPRVLRNLSKQAGVIDTVTAALRAAHPDAKIGFVGFCFGGRYAMMQNAIFDATVACHPSGFSFPAGLDAISKPFSLAAASGDHFCDAKRAREVEKILAGKGLTDVEVRVYEGVDHGWTCRADLEDEVQRMAKEEAVRQVVGWFEKYLS